MQSGFGAIYSTNITPDPDHGIGRWSAEDFWHALHDGVRRDGEQLYPAMPRGVWHSPQCPSTFTR